MNKLNLVNGRSSFISRKSSQSFDRKRRSDDVKSLELEVPEKIRTGGVWGFENAFVSDPTRTTPSKRSRPLFSGSSFVRKKRTLREAKTREADEIHNRREGFCETPRTPETKKPDVSLFGDSPLPDLFDSPTTEESVHLPEAFSPAPRGTTPTNISASPKARKSLLKSSTEFRTRLDDAVKDTLEYSDFATDSSLFDRIPAFDGVRVITSEIEEKVCSGDGITTTPKEDLFVRQTHIMKVAEPIQHPPAPLVGEEDLEFSSLHLPAELSLTSTPNMGKCFKRPVIQPNGFSSPLPSESGVPRPTRPKNSPAEAVNGLSPESQSSLNLSLESNSSLQSSFQDRLKRTFRENVKTEERGEAMTEDRGERMAKKREEMERFAEEAKEELKESLAREPETGPFFGLPIRVKNIFANQRNISSLYKWQEECLTLESVARRQNLIYSLPTSGGKTLVAEILMLREILLQRRDAAFVLPYVAIVQEKVRGLAPFAVQLGFSVEEYAGAKGAFPPRKKRKRNSVFVCTIEKAASLINSLIENGQRQNEIGLFVVDELHMIGDGTSRGALLETTLTKVLSCCPDAQIVGMSATLSNVSDLKSFLGAQVYENDFRPVELREFVKVGSSVFSVEKSSNASVDAVVLTKEKLRHDRFITFPYNKVLEKQDPDHLIGLVSEVIPEKSCLVFCASKKNCENVAEMLCRHMPEKLRRNRESERRTLYETLLIETPGGVCPTLAKTLPYGVAYHHSGLTTDERRLIEEAYCSGVLCLLTCTSTLAAGVNLPAKRVILRSPYIGLSLMSRSRYKQMVGRAGRAGIDDSGESYLIVKPEEQAKISDIVSGSCDACISSLASVLRESSKENNGKVGTESSKSLKQMILSCVGLGIASSVTDVEGFLGKTLLYVQRERLGVDVVKLAANAIQELVQNRLLCRCRLEEELDSQDLNLPRVAPFASSESPVDSKTLSVASPLFVVAPQTHSHSRRLVADLHGCFLRATIVGRAAYKGGVDLDWAQRLYDDLKANLQVTQHLNLECNLHLLYLVTPYDAVADIKPQWMTYFDTVSQLDEVEVNAAELIGVRESYLAMRARGVTRVKSRGGPVDEFVVARFYLTLVLRELLAEKTVWQVAAKFKLDRGFIQNLLNRASAFSVCVLHFSEELQEFWAYPLLFRNFIPKLNQCSNPELNHLMEIPGVKIARAKQLSAANYKKIADVAQADPSQLMSAVRYLPRKQAENLIESAKMILNNMVEALEEQAAEMKESNRGGDGEASKPEKS